VNPFQSGGQQPSAGKIAEPALSQKYPKHRRYLGKQVIIVLIVLPLVSYLLATLNLYTTVYPTADSEGERLISFIDDGLSLAIFILLLLSWLLKWHRVVRVVTLVNLVFVTIGLGLSDVMLVLSITEYKGSQGGSQLLGDAAAIWGLNIIVFAIWYWFTDGGGPLKREAGETRQTDFVFPQQASEFEGYPNWKPRFLDYFFLAFNHNMAFSPTDTLILSQRAKLLVMLQTTFALLTFAIALARAIGVVGS
jgi:hypothetical protein